MVKKYFGKFVPKQSWFDTNGDGDVDYKDFIAAAQNTLNALTPSNAVLDINGDGVIDIKDALDAARITGATIAGAGDVDVLKQRENLDAVVAAISGAGVDFSWAFDDTGTAHARHISTDHGWKISLDRGLDIFQQYPMSDAFSLANRMQEQRAIKQFEITYLRA